METFEFTIGLDDVIASGYLCVEIELKILLLRVIIFVESMKPLTYKYRQYVWYVTIIKSQYNDL